MSLNGIGFMLIKTELSGNVSTSITQCFSTKTLIKVSKVAFHLNILFSESTLKIKGNYYIEVWYV